MTDGKRVLIIDDDPAFRQMLNEQLTELGGYQCEVAPDGATGLKMALDQHVDVVLLDTDLPDFGGLAVCRQLRAQGMMAPIIMVSANDSEKSIISSLDAGATDCVVKPFKIGVLLARMRAHIRQFAHSDDAVLVIGPFAFRPGAKTLMFEEDSGVSHHKVQGQGVPRVTLGRDAPRPVRLTDKEVQILKYLYLHAQDSAKNGSVHNVVGREELLGEVWGYNAAVTTHTLETHVYRLRQKMERDPGHAEILVTEPGGYRLNL
ncbi:MAG: response regulator transcription factor [Rhodospirillales bacterium]|nr:response regulator transcription factor [Rhodospirillales bacterium]